MFPEMPEETDDQPQGPAQLREAYDREKARRAELESQLGEAETLKRENAMLKAGVDLGHPAAEYFTAGYKGELDADAIKDAWSKIAGTQPATPSEETAREEVDDGPTEAEREQQRLRGVLTTDATPPGSEPAPDPWEQAYGEFHSPSRTTQPRERRAAAAVQHVINAANNGDERVVFQKPGEDLAAATERWRREKFG